MSYDRDAILDRIDLPALADDVLGPHHGRGTERSWPCPDPRHGPQTGRTPPVSIFTGRSGIQLWHCHACGAGGTAIDLVITTHDMRIRDAIDWLAQRAGIDPHDTVRPSTTTTTAQPDIARASTATRGKRGSARVRRGLRAAPVVGARRPLARLAPSTRVRRRRVAREPRRRRPRPAPPCPRARSPATRARRRVPRAHRRPRARLPAGPLPRRRTRRTQVRQPRRRTWHPTLASRSCTRLAPAPADGALVVCEGLPDALTVAGDWSACRRCARRRAP